MVGVHRRRSKGDTEERDVVEEAQQDRRDEGKAFVMKETRNVC